MKTVVFTLQVYDVTAKISECVHSKFLSELRKWPIITHLYYLHSIITLFVDG